MHCSVYTYIFTKMIYICSMYIYIHIYTYTFIYIYIYCIHICIYVSIYIYIYAAYAHLCVIWFVCARSAACISNSLGSPDRHFD